MPTRTSPSAQSSFPEPLVRFVELFNRQEFWDSHEVLEDAWRESRSGFYHGLILYASAFVHVQRKNARGVVAQLRKAEKALLPYDPDYLGIDVRRILLEARERRERMERPGEPSEGWVDDPSFPRIRLDPQRVLGTEEESSDEGP